MSAPATIAYLGPAGTYSDEAAHLFAQRMGTEAHFAAKPSFNTVFDEVDRGKVDFGVVPTENSLEGAVTSTLDNFAFSSSAQIVGEQILSIHHCLLLHPDATKADVKVVASHAQGLIDVFQERSRVCRALPQHADHDHREHRRERPTSSRGPLGRGHRQRLRSRTLRCQDRAARHRGPLRQPDELRPHHAARRA